MEKIEQTTAAPEKVKVVIMGAGPAPKELRDAFPDAEFIDTNAPTGEVEEEAPLELLAEIGEVLGKLRSATRAACQCHKSVLSEEKLNGEPVPADVEKVMRETAYSKLKEIAAGFGLGFNEQELDALYRLSLAFNPSLAIAVANTACRKFINHWGH